MALSEFFNVSNERANSAKLLHVKVKPKKSVFCTTNAGLIKKNPVHNAKGFIGRGLMVLPTMAFSSQ